LYLLTATLVFSVHASPAGDTASAPVDAAAFDDELGEIRFIVLPASPNQSIKGITVRVGDVYLGATDEDGVLSAELFGGLYHFTFDIGENDHRTASAVRVKPNVLVQATVEIPAGSTDIVVHSEKPSPSLEVVPAAISGASASVAIQVVDKETGVEVEEVTVTAAKVEGGAASLQTERRESTQVTDIIGAEQFSKSGDSNAAAALKRVTGVTIVDGKYVYVRGLGERYSSTTLNGLNLPSPDPERRVVPLDMFPSEMLDSLVIQKTFSPDMPGDFGGGTVILRTRAYPKEPLFKIELGGAISLGSTFNGADFSSDKGPTDFLGIDGGHRAMSKTLKDATENQPLTGGSLVSPGYTEEELSTITKSLPENWGIDQKTVPPDFKLALTGGNSWKIKNNEIGFLASLLYKNEWDTSYTDKREYALDAGNLQVQNRYLVNDTINTVNLGGMFTLGASLGDSNKIVSNTMVDRITDNDFYVYEAYHSDFDGRVYNYEWIERMLFCQQILGTHTLKAARDLKVDWRYGFSTASDNEPDKRFVQYDYADSSRDVDTLAVSSMTNANRRDYLVSNDKIHDLGLDLSLPFLQWTKEKGHVKTGGAVTLKDRETDVRRFAYDRLGNLDAATRSLPPSEFFVDENMGTDGMRLIEVTAATDNYTGEQEIFAYYLTGDLPLGLGFSASAGVRLEKAHQEVATYKLFAPSGEMVVRSFDNLDVLPSVVFTYEVRKGMLLRLGYGKTVNRPDFREMSAGCAMGYAGAGMICGAPAEVENPEWTPDSPDEVPPTIPYTLVPATIHNVDARWEWYFSEDESISLGAFYKHFIDPIELIFRASTDKSSELRNAEAADNVGIEFEFKKNFSFIRKALSDLYFAGNISWIFSQIVIPDSNQLIVTNQERPLQGQSPYVINAQIGYDNADIGLSALVLYNISGPRIATVGVSGLPDIYEQPFHQLDLVIKQKIPKGFQLGFKAVNLIDLPSTFTQGEEITKTYTKGRELSLTLSWSY
jgi:outer membrane receptor protein involved in Fe transport